MPVLLTYSTLKDFQSLAVGVIGFGGVIVTLFTNAALARRQHARQVQHEAQILRAALNAELELIREAVADRIEMINTAKPGQGTLVPLDSLSDVYASLMDRIGFLSERETRAVVRAYVLVQQLPERVKILERQHVTNEEREARWAWVDGALFNALKKLHENYLTVVDAALMEIRQYLP